MIAAAFIFLIQHAEEAKPPFWSDIQNFKKKDAAAHPAKGQILFIGSSSFTYWRDASQRFPDKQILNRAFGGSSLTDLIRYADDLLDPYAPKQIFIYCGENDLASAEKPSAYKVYNRFLEFYRIIRRKLPTTPVAYVSMKPSWSRWHLRGKYITANRWIEELATKDNSLEFVNVWDAMLDANGRPKVEIFINDELHMNGYGYDIWTPILAKYMK
jgi:lysophospholipase L1-like esterase